MATITSHYISVFVTVYVLYLYLPVSVCLFVCGKDTVLQTKQTGFRVRGLLLASQPVRQTGSICNSCSSSSSSVCYFYLLFTQKTKSIHLLLCYVCFSLSGCCCWLGTYRNCCHFERHFWSHMRAWTKLHI